MTFLSYSSDFWNFDSLNNKVYYVRLSYRIILKIRLMDLAIFVFFINKKKQKHAKIKLRSFVLILAFVSGYEKRNKSYVLLFNSG